MNVSYKNRIATRGTFRMLRKRVCLCVFSKKNYTGPSYTGRENFIQDYCNRGERTELCRKKKAERLKDWANEKVLNDFRKEIRQCH